MSKDLEQPLTPIDLEHVPKYGNVLAFYGTQTGHGTDTLFSYVEPEHAPWMIDTVSRPGPDRTPLQQAYQVGKTVVGVAGPPAATAAYMKVGDPSHAGIVLFGGWGVGATKILVGMIKDRVDFKNRRKELISYYVAGGKPIPSMADPMLLQGENQANVFATQIETDYEGISVTGKSVVDWLAFCLDGKIPLLRVQGQKPFLYHLGHSIVHPDTSLYQMYLSAPGVDGSSSDGTARDFLRSAENLASELGAELQPHYYKYKDPKKAELLRTVPNWRDAPGTLMCVEPADFMVKMLTETANPNALWTSVTPQIADLMKLYAEITPLRAQLKHLRDVRALTKVYSPDDNTKEKGLTEQVQENRLRQVDNYIQIAGSAMVAVAKDRAIGLHEGLKEKILAAMQSSHKATDQKGALALLDIALTAVASKPELTASGGERYSKDLDTYLVAAAGLSDGTEETWQRLYQGMAEQFPALKLPPKIAPKTQDPTTKPRGC